MNKYCENCAHYNPYCRAGCFCFWKENSGVCLKSGNAADRFGSCEFWEKSSPQKLTVELIDKAIDDVKFIKQNF